MFSISGEELSKEKKAGKYAKCKRCGEKHVIQIGKKKMPDGTYQEDGLIGYVECNDGQIYLASINGKIL